MAITQFSLTTGQSGVDVNSATTASFTPTANRLVLVAVSNRATSGTTNAASLSGNGLTWVQVLGSNWADSPSHRISVFRAMGDPPSSGTLSITFAGQTQSRIAWSIMEFAGIDTSGTNGSGAIVQSNATGTYPGTAASTTLGVAPDTSSATYGVSSYVTTASTTTAGSGFTEIDEQSSAQGVGLSTEWRADAVQTINATNTANVNNIMAGIEIKVAGAAATGVSGAGHSVFRLPRRQWSY